MPAGIALTESESRKLLEECGIPTGAYRVAKNAQLAAAAASEIGFPVVLKVVSKQIIHKSDVGGVRVGLANPDAVVKACAEIEASALARVPDAVIDGYLVAPVFSGGVEVIIGLTRDPQFGPVVMTGLGGIFVEVLKDVAFRAALATRADAMAMLSSLKAAAIFRGVRGKAPADLPALAELIEKVSRVVSLRPDVQEIDLNPVMVFSKGVAVLDARVVLGQ